MKKCICKDLPTSAYGKQVEVYGDYGIESAYVNDKGMLIANFVNFERLQEWNQTANRKKEFLESHGLYVGKDYQLHANSIGTAFYRSIPAIFNEDEYFMCEMCEEIVEIDKRTYVENYGDVCEDCLNSGDFFVCEDCGEWHHIDDMVDVHTSCYLRDDHPKHVCQECADDDYFMCDDCRQYFTRECVDEAPNGHYFCNDHFYDHCDICCQCGETIWEDEAYHDDDGNAYCEQCWNTHGEGNHIRSYHNNPNRVYHYTNDEENDGRRGKLIGTEVETDSDDDNVEERADITWEKGAEEKYIYQMHDGSLSDYGIECITQPMSYKFWSQFNFEEWMNSLIEAGARSHDTDTCGLHVHLSRTWLETDDWDEQAVLVGRMRQFLADNKDLVQRFARRTEERWCRYKKSFDKEEMPGNKEERAEKHKHNAKDNDRYTSVNNKNSDTVEFRIFKGTLKPNTYRASVEFCLRVVDYIVHHEENTETWKEFITYKPLPESMKKYMTERGMQTTF